MEIQQEHNKPYIYLDEANCILKIKSESYPEYAEQFYEQILEYIKECLPKVKQNTVTINLAMTLMNSVSEKSIFQMVKLLTEVNELIINWYYEDDDEDMEEEGKTWKALLKNVKFNIHPIKDIDTLHF